MSWRLSLRVPDLKASDVKLHTAAAPGGADAFHHILSLRDGPTAGVTAFPVPSAAPHARDAVLWQLTASELTLDEQAERVIFHETPRIQRVVHAMPLRA
jgi:hypothetical protein